MKQKYCYKCDYHGYVFDRLNGYMVECPNCDTVKKDKIGAIVISVIGAIVLIALIVTGVLTN